jgi:hypothetical protein
MPILGEVNLFLRHQIYSCMSERKYEYDWVRVLAFGLLIPYHTAMIFSPPHDGWHIKNFETSELIEVLKAFINRWRLPLLFFIAGVGTFYALRKASLASFSRERCWRLLLPLVFGMFVIIPPQIYFEHLQKGATYSYVEFYPSVFNFVPYPKGSFSWHHLWFVAYLFVFSLISLPIFAYRHSAVGKVFSNNSAVFFSKGYNMYLIFLPALLLHFFLDKYFPTTHNLIWDWANFSVSWFVFLVGYWLATDERFMERLRQLRFMSLFWALLGYFLLVLFWKTGMLKPVFSQESRSLIYMLIDYVLGSFAILAIIGFAKEHLNFSNAFLTYANRAVYPFYILHQTLIVCIGFYVVQWAMNLWLKFLIINILTFLLTWFLYEISKRFALTRVLLGIK